MKTPGKVLRDRRGEGYLRTVVLILILCLILSVALAESLLVGTVHGARSRMRFTVDSWLQSHAVATFDALKRGTGYGGRLDEEDIRRGVLEALGYGPDGSGTETFGDERGVHVRCSEPEVRVDLYPDAVQVTVSVRTRGYAYLFGAVRILPDVRVRVRAVYALREGAAP